MRKSISALITFLAVIAIVTSCANRYRMDLYLTMGEKSKRVDVEQTQYAPMTILAGPEAEIKIVQGMGNTVMIGTGTRGERQEKLTKYDVFGFDQFLHYQIYVQLPVQLTPGPVPLQGNSFVQILGQYELEQKKRLFLPQAGNFVIDSVSHKHLFGTLKGEYANSDGARLAFDGRIKIKVAD
jgi:hypothetical protein